MSHVTVVGSSYVSNRSVAFQNPSGVVSQESFLRLLITELKYQDPLSPAQSQEFLSQLTQLTQLETANKTNSSIEFLKAAALLGKRVEGVDPKTGSAISGVVTGVEPGKTSLIYVGDQRLYLDNIKFVGDRASL